jgi:predicted MFS family arabinose efflux permease
MVPSAVGLVAVTFGLARYGYGLLLPDMRAELGIGAASAGVIRSSRSPGTTRMTAPCVRGLGAAVVATLCCSPPRRRSRSCTWGVVMVVSGLFGVSHNAVIAVHGMWNADVFSERPSAGLAAVSTALTLGTLIGPAAGGRLIEAFGNGPALLAAAAVTALALLLAHRLRERVRGHPRRDPEPNP